MYASGHHQASSSGIQRASKEHQELKKRLILILGVAGYLTMGWDPRVL
jgi:hypothetical protein